MSGLYIFQSNPYQYVGAKSDTNKTFTKDSECQLEQQAKALKAITQIFGSSVLYFRASDVHIDIFWA